MDKTALFKLTYGVFILGTEFEGKINACIVNTVSQVTTDPIRVSVNVLKTNYTSELINNSQKFSVSILSKNASIDTIARFGYVSGRDTDKFKDFEYELDSEGCPIVKEGSNAVLSCKVINTLDLDTHYMFIGEVTDSKKLNDEESMTYVDYRNIKSGNSISSEKKESKVQYECSVCHYIYDGDIPFEELPDDYVCPICGQPKSVFHQI